METFTALHRDLPREESYFYGSIHVLCPTIAKLSTKPHLPVIIAPLHSGWSAVPSVFPLGNIENFCGPTWPKVASSSRADAAEQWQYSHHFSASALDFVDTSDSFAWDDGIYSSHLILVWTEMTAPANPGYWLALVCNLHFCSCRGDSLLSELLRRYRACFEWFCATSSVWVFSETGQGQPSYCSAE